MSVDVVRKSKWPKQRAPLSPEQERISNDFMKYWLELLPHKYGIVEKFNHGYVVEHSSPTFLRTLEVGAGLGEHLKYERLTPQQEENYYPLELRSDLSQQTSQRFPRVKATAGDCQDHLPFPDGFFDRIIAIHVLEHLPNLPAALREMHRLCSKQHGRLHIVIPTEGSPALAVARRLSSQRLFEARYHQPYSWFIRREHINYPNEILEELAPYFQIQHKSYFPLPFIPAQFCNVAIGITLCPRSGAQ